MARGQRTDLASLAAAVGKQSPVDNAAPAPATGATAPLSDLVPNPRNPRDDVGNLDDLASIADLQLQPALVVTKKAYQRLYPDDGISARYVVVNGCRRLAAAHKYGRTDLAIVVNDDVARDRVTLISASIAENVDRQDFDVIEEAKAVEALVEACGRADEAAARLHKTPAWVSQRRALLKLDPQLQTALRRGELAIREARSLARVPMEQQVARWRAALEKNDDDQRKRPPADKRSPSRARMITEALDQFDSRPEALAEALHSFLGDDGVIKLLDMLSNRTG
jgi:ParB family chromosome partitioning protein